MTSSPLLSALSREFDVEPRGDGVRARRRRPLPSRGLFRLLIPRVVVTVGADRSISVRPDVVALVMLVVCLGGVLVELTMSRAVYPRSYPAEFPLALSAFYAGALGWEWKRSHARASALLKAT